jgi:hypothetical protein
VIGNILFGLFAVFCLFVVVAVAVQRDQENRRRHARKMDLLSTAKACVTDDCFVSADSSCLIGLNFNDAQVVLLCPEASGVFPYGDISSCEVIKDDVSVTQTNRGGQALGAVVGGMIAGPVGALAGSLTGSKRARNRISRLELKVVVDSKQNPVYRIPFFISNDKKGSDSRDTRLTTIIAQIDRFHAHVANAIRKADQIRIQAPSAIALPGSSIPTAQLKELFELKQIGAITDVDYEQAKARLLAPPLA